MSFPMVSRTKAAATVTLILLVVLLSLCILLPLIVYGLPSGGGARGTSAAHGRDERSGNSVLQQALGLEESNAGENRKPELSQKILPDAPDPLGKTLRQPPALLPRPQGAVKGATENRTKPQASHAHPATLTNGLVRAAQLVKATVNESANPCDDFYEFACGKWIAANPIPDDLTSYGHFSALREKVNAEMKDLFEDTTPSTSQSISTLKQIYSACMDLQTINAKKSTLFLRAVEKLGYWPILHGVAPDVEKLTAASVSLGEGEREKDDPLVDKLLGPVNSNTTDVLGRKWSRKGYNLTKLMIDIGVTRAIDVFVDVYVSLDQRDVKRRLLHFDQGGLGLGTTARDYYLNATRYSKQMVAYEKFMFEKLRQLGEDANLIDDAVVVELDEERLRKDVKEIIEFEKNFAKILTPESERRNFTKMYNLKRFSDMQELMPQLEWDTYFRALMPPDMHWYLDSNPEIIINEPEFFQRLNKFLAESDPRVVTDYIIWRYTAAWTYQLDERYDDIHQTFLKAFVGRQRKSPRWKDCNAAASGRMSYASGAMYVRRYFNKQDREAAQLMVEDIRGAFRGMLLENDWMEESTKGYALEKAKQMQSLIGFPDFIYNDTALDEYYANFTVSPEDDYAAMVQRASQWSQLKAFRRLTEPVDRSEFGTSSAVVNAFYSAVKNGITFPAAILQSPFFDRSFPKALNYGCIGSVIGHEITHGFDDQGSQFDKIGNLQNWWDPSTHSRFLNRTRCIIDQYSSYEVPDTGLRINGVLTQGENVADNGGIKQAYRAYRASVERQGREEPSLPGLEHFTNDQLFFISYAQTWCGSSKPETAIRQVLVDPHSPMRFRVNGVLVNQPEFAAAFKCPVGAQMNPEKRCTVW